MTGWLELLYLLNVFCIWYSWRAADECFEYGNTRAGWINVLASALNAAIVADHFI